MSEQSIDHHHLIADDANCDNSPVINQSSSIIAEPIVTSEEIKFGNDGKYIVDASLCGVGSHLRKLGVDAEYSKEYSDAYILYLARTQNRLIITRSTKLLQKIRQQEERLVNYRKKIEILGNKEMVASLIQQRLMKHKTDEEIEEEREGLIETVNEEEKQKYNYYIVKSIGRSLIFL